MTKNVIIKKFEPFILGFCKCGCGTEIPIRSKNRGELRLWAEGHHTKMENNYFWKGGMTIDKDNYVLVKKRDHPNSNKQGYIRLHRLIMSEHLGRPLEKGEEVHHKDGNTLNNDISNLELLQHNIHSSISAIKDHGDRTCAECGAGKTYMSKDKKTGKYYSCWYELGENKWLCRKCGRRRKYKETGKN